MKILVTGGAGFIGSHIAQKLTKSGNDVTIVDNLSTGKMENVPAECEFYELDLGNVSSVDFFKNRSFDAVLHLAGQSSGEASFTDPVYDFNANLSSTFNLLKMCKEQGIYRFIYASSMGVYGEPEYLPVDEKHPVNPKSYYGVSKVSAENYINFFSKLGIKTTIFRMFNVYGPGQNLGNLKQGMVSIYLSFLLAGEPITVKGHKSRFRDFIYIDDVVEAWINSITNEKTYNKTYNLATGIRTTVDELLKQLFAAFDYTDYPIIFAASTDGDQTGLVANIKSFSTDLGWLPRTKLKEGVIKTVKYELRRIDTIDGQ